jgi:polyhydroxybutyrate depolymerase
MRAAATLAIAAALAVATGARAEAGRGYTFYVPRSAAPTGKLPLIVVLHCYGCDGPEIVMDMLRLDEVADRHGVMLLLPDGRIDRHGQRYWSATEACCNFDGAPDDDVAFIAHLLDEAVARRRADPERIYLAGYSNGGFFAHRLACDLPGRIAGIISVAGAGLFDSARCKAGPPVAVVEVHGDRDDIVPYGGETLGKPLPKRGKLPSAPATVAAWAKHNGCRGETGSGGEADLEETIHGAETHIERYAGCKRPVELWTIRGGSHGLRLTADFGERIWSFLSAPVLSSH